MCEKWFWLYIILLKVFFFDININIFWDFKVVLILFLVGDFFLLFEFVFIGSLGLSNKGFLFFFVVFLVDFFIEFVFIVIGIDFGFLIKLKYLFSLVDKEENLVKIIGLYGLWEKIWFLLEF